MSQYLLIFFVKSSNMTLAALLTSHPAAVFVETLVRSSGKVWCWSANTGRTTLQPKPVDFNMQLYCGSQSLSEPFSGPQEAFA
ncbi:MAG TPA: hypothetical protein VFR84_03670, partial [Candidatus Angelobacter sp.]|nr:hypothetical protein [Candidatus Angelobacter sp.]